MLYSGGDNIFYTYRMESTMINVLLTVIWLGSAGQPNERVELYTDSFEYCEQLRQQILNGDGALLAFCSYLPPM